MVRVPAQADVVVIGGGPAGSTAANLLARRGYHVVLIEKARHPRPTVGEALLPHFWKYADELDAAADIARHGFVRKGGGTTIWHGHIREVSLSVFGFDRPALHVERDQFDAILLNAARRRGVNVFENVVVREVRFDGDLAVAAAFVERESGDAGEIRCRSVIDASGQAAVIAHQLGFREFDRDLRFMSIWGYFSDSDYVAAGGTIHPFASRFAVPPHTLLSGIGEWGWAWHIAQQDAASVGLVLTPAQASELKSRASTLEERFLIQCRETPGLHELLREATLLPGSVRAIRDFAYYPTRLAGPNWYLAGDAAAFVDPINSAGVLVAFYGGFLAAWAVERSLDRPSRARHVSAQFEELLRRRLALYRIAALPGGENSYPEIYSVALPAVQLESAVERELLHVQSELIHRPGNLSPLSELDGRVRFESSRYRTLDRLERMVIHA